MPWFGRPLMLLMGAIFSVVGGALVFGRTWTTFDANTRTIVMQMGLVVPMSATTYRLDDYTSLVLDFQRGDSDSADQFPISLRARAGKNLRLFSSTQYAEARERAAAIASLLHLDIEDASTDHPVKLSAAQANLSFQHRRAWNINATSLSPARCECGVKSRPAMAVSSSSYRHSAGILPCFCFF